MRVWLFGVALAALAACGGHPVTPATPRPAPTPPPPAPAPPPAVEPAPPAEPPPPPPPITIAAVGDIMLGSTSRDGGGLPPDDGAGYLAAATPTLSGADLTFGNLEGPLVDEGGGVSKCDKMRALSPGRKITCYAFSVPTRYAAHLAAAGFDVMSIANNHAMDFGADGRASTERALDAAGIRYSGEPGSVAELEVKGRKLALIAFTTAPHSNDLNDIDAAVALVSAAAASHDLVVVSFHGGGEGEKRTHVVDGMEMFLGEKRGDLRRFTHAVVDAGADLVLGHGPHVLRGMEIYNRHLIAYSLGNFATYYGISIRGAAGITAVLEVTLDAEGALAGGRIHPMVQKRPGGPTPDPSGKAIEIVRALSRQDFGQAAAPLSPDGVISLP